MNDACSWDAARRLTAGKLVSILMPAHNLAPVIAANIETVRRALDGHISAYEIVVIDDGSRDNTAAEIRRAAEACAQVRPVILAHNRGKGGALRRGFEASRGDFIVLLDADLDLPPQQIWRLFDVMARTAADVVIGSKMHPESELAYPPLRRLMSAAYYLLVRMLFGLPIRDSQTGLKLFRRPALEWAFPRMLVKAFAFDLEILAIIHMKGFAIREAPVTIEFHGAWGCVTGRTIEAILWDTLAIFYRIRILRYYQAIPDMQLPEPAPLVSVIALLDDEPAPLLDALAVQTYRPFEVILVSAARRTIAHACEPSVIACGRATAAERRNAGMAHARGRIIAFVDVRDAPDREWMEQAVRPFSLPYVGAVAGPVADAPGAGWAAAQAVRVDSRTAVSGRYRYRYQATRIRETDDYPAHNLFVRRERIEQFGGFDAQLGAAADTHLCARIRTSDTPRILYEPRALLHGRREPLFGAHAGHAWRRGRAQGESFRRLPALTARRIPALLAAAWLVVGLACAGAAACVPAFRAPFLVLTVAYVAIVCAAAFSTSLRAWGAACIGIPLTHAAHGAGFLAGLASGRPIAASAARQTRAPAISAAPAMPVAHLATADHRSAALDPEA